MIIRLFKAVAMLCGSLWLAWVVYINMSARDALEGTDEQMAEMSADARAERQRLRREEQLAGEGWSADSASGQAAPLPKWKEEDGWGAAAE